MGKPKRVIIAIGGSYSFGPRVIRGIVKYLAEHQPWDVYFEDLAHPTSFHLRRLVKVAADWQASGVITYSGSGGSSPHTRLATLRSCA